MAGRRFKVTGVTNLQKNLDRVLHALQKAAVASLKAEAEVVLEKAKSRTPVDTGQLRDSGHVVADKNEVRVVFDAPHALVVHEDLAAHHDNGEAKFLEATLSEAEPGMIQRIGAGVRKRIRS
jgi:hypothetical protein